MHFIAIWSGRYLLIHRVCRHTLELVVLMWWLIVLLHCWREGGVGGERSRGIVARAMVALVGILWHGELLMSAEIMRICAWYSLRLAQFVERRARMGVRMLRVVVVVVVVVVLRGVGRGQVVQLNVPKLEQVGQVVQTGTQRQRVHLFCWPRPF